jgi:hypothetical protein
MLYKNAVVKRFKVRVVPERRLKMIELSQRRLQQQADFGNYGD